MKKFAILCTVMALLVLTVYLCDTRGERLSKKYIKSKGYEIVSVNRNPIKERLSKEDLLSSERQQHIWMVQNQSPDYYFGKYIVHYGFIVKNHPMDKFSPEGTGLWIMVCNNKIIGGYSFPKGLVGGTYHSIERLSGEEVTGMSLKNWLDEWVKKYNDN